MNGEGPKSNVLSVYVSDVPTPPAKPDEVEIRMLEGSEVNLAIKVKWLPPAN